MDDHGPIGSNGHLRCNQFMFVPLEQLFERRNHDGNPVDWCLGDTSMCMKTIQRRRKDVHWQGCLAGIGKQNSFGWKT